MSNYVIFPRNSPSFKELPEWGFKNENANAIIITNLLQDRFQALQRDRIDDLLSNGSAGNAALVLNTSFAQEADISAVLKLISASDQQSHANSAGDLWRLWIHTGDRNVRPNEADWEQIFRSPDWSPYSPLRPYLEIEWYSVGAKSEGDHHSLIAAAAKKVSVAITNRTYGAEAIECLDRAWHMTRKQSQVQANYDELVCLFPLFLEQSAGMQSDNIEDIAARIQKLNQGKENQESSWSNVLYELKAGTVDAQSFCKLFEAAALKVTHELCPSGDLKFPTHA